MLYKKTLLIAFFLSLFILQQTQVSAKFSSNEEMSQIDLIQASALPSQLYITVAHLNENSYPIYANNEIVKCYYTDPAYGCGEGGSGYPYTQNPLWIDVENDYLLDVLPREMNVKENSRTLASLQAQALAARSYADFRFRRYGAMDNSVNFQIFIPNAYELYDPSSSAIIYQAVTSTQGQYLSYNNESVDAQFASDSVDRTATCKNADGSTCRNANSSSEIPYLIEVQDPISSSECGANNNGQSQTPGDDFGKVWGMSQKGAIRWSLGNQCAGSGNQPWSVTWSDYRQILVHYYTGIDILNASGAELAPDNRWNLLNHNAPGAVNSGQPFTVNLRVQNTSISDWSINNLILGYQWRDSQNNPIGSWTDATYLPAMVKGKDEAVPVNILPPPTGGTYNLHLDLKYQGSDWFSNAGWPDAKITVDIAGPTATSTVAPGSRGFYPSGIHVKYYNDVAPAQIFLDQPINWNTFTTLAAESDVQMINFDWGTTSPAPGVNAVFWSARYEGQLLVPQDGTYTFYLEQLDDGGRLYIDDDGNGIFENGDMIIDKWLVQGPHVYSESVSLTAGQHLIKIEYAQGPGSEGSLSVAWELPGVFTKDLIGPASVATNTPGPTPTPIGGTPVTPPPTAFVTPNPPTPIPTTATPDPGCRFGSSQSAVRLAGVTSTNYYSTPTSPAQFISSAAEVFDIAQLLYQIRDEILSQTPEGQRLTLLYYAHSAEIATLMLSDEVFDTQGLDTLNLFVPGLQALVDGNGNTVTITAEQVNAAQAFLDELSSIGSPELQQAIQAERERYHLESMIGLTMDQAWTYVNGFPSTAVLDNFNRANGSIGSNWLGYTSKYHVTSNQMTVDYNGSNSDIYWNNLFGADQEAYVTFTDIDSTASEQDLLLKAQSNTTWGDGVIEVLYDPTGQTVQVWTYEWPDGWTQHGADIPVAFVDGDIFGARALANGTVEVYKNGTLLASRDITAWLHYADGGYIGLWFIAAEDAVLDDFGGGTISGGTAPMSMLGGPTESENLMPAQLDVNVQNTVIFWQGIPIGSNQQAGITFTNIPANKQSLLLKPQSNGMWGDGVVEVFYDVAGQRIQVWMYDAQTGNGWMQYGKDIPVKFTAGDTFSVQVLADGTVEIQWNGKLLAKRDVTP